MKQATRECPHHKLRSDLPPLPPRIERLPVDERGYPVPFFVATIDGKPEFRIADEQKLIRCVRFNLCWVCGEPLGSRKAFTVGPMCCVNRTSAEPPEHLGCAEWSVKGCPFLSRPKMIRREDELTESMKGNVAGIPILRNPGVIAIWVTKSVSRFQANGVLFNFGEPESVTWWREGRPATRAEILESVETGLPALMKVAEIDPRRDEAIAELNRRVAELKEKYLP